MDDRLRWQLLLLAAVIVSLTEFVHADDRPSVERIFPPGGQVGTAVEVEIKGKVGDSPLKVWSDRSELQIELAEDNQSATVTIPDNARPGPHWLRFHNEFETAALRPFIVGIIPEIADDEPNNRLEDAQPLEPPAVTINGILESTGDVDIYQVDVPAGRTLVASMAANRQLGSPMDAVLQVLDANGTVVAQNDDDHGLDPQIAFDVPSEGTWYLRTFAFPATPNSTIRLAGGTTYVYRLTVTTGPFVDHTLPAVVNRRGNSEVTICGWNLVEQQRRIAVPWSKESEILLLEDFALPYPITVIDHSSRTETDQSRVLDVGSSITGRIAQTNETDVYTLRATKGQQLTVGVSSRAIDSLLDPVLAVKAADGNVLAEADDRSGSDLDSEVAFTVSDDGPLTVTVSDRYQAGGFRHFYMLTCREPQPAFTATVNAISYVLSTDKPLGITVTITRTNGFAKELTVAVEGLPDGVTAEPLNSAPKGDSAGSVSLQLIRSETATGFSGPIRIVCTLENAERQSAQAAIPASRATTSDIWLTVRPVGPTEKPSSASSGK